MTERERQLESFRIFNRRGGKFRVAIVNRCNLDCFFCHNEGMANPRRPVKTAVPVRLDDSALIGIVNAFTRLGGRQVNLTGGEPLLHPRLEQFLERIEKRRTRVVLNTNAVPASRLLGQPRIDTIDGILASLHTADAATFQSHLGGRRDGVANVLDNLVALRDHGYDIEVNYSLGDYNRSEFGAVLDFVRRHRLPLKVISLIRPNEEPDFYGGDWIDPDSLHASLSSRGGRMLRVKEALGGRTAVWDLAGLRVQVKNVARGRLYTDFCHDCSHRTSCGEGIYGLRVGVDGLWKPCLLRREAFWRVEPDRSYEEQILENTARMIGDWQQARFEVGAPA